MKEIIVSYQCDYTIISLLLPIKPSPSHILRKINYPEISQNACDTNHIMLILNLEILHLMMYLIIRPDILFSI